MTQSILLLETRDEKRDIEQLEEMEFQIFRMRENLFEIAKKWEVVAIDQTKEEQWVILYKYDDGNQCQIMLNECETAYTGQWDFCIQATYTETNTIHINDIKGPVNKGYGSVCMSYLQQMAEQKNIQYLTGDLVQRDWNHINRLIAFYEKHHFQVSVNAETKSGRIIWNPQ